MILKRFNIEREETDPKRIEELKAEGFEEVKEPKKAKKAPAKKASEKHGTDK